MELKIVSILGTIIVLLHVSEARPYLIDIQDADSEQDAIMAADKRPKYMDASDLSAFQDTDLYTMVKEVEDSEINQELLVPKSATAPEGIVKRQNREKRLCAIPSGMSFVIVPCYRKRT